MAKELTKYRVTDGCIICGLCENSCPFEGIKDGISERGFPKMLIEPELCKGCELCVPHCPLGAIVPGIQHELESLDSTDNA